MVKRIICFDLDGTLVDDTGKIHPQDIALLKRLPGDFIFIPASGRSLDSVKRLFARNGLFVDQKIPIPLILQNGSLVYDAGERLLKYLPFSSKIQAQLVEMAVKLNEITYLFMGDAFIHQIWSHPFGLSAIQKYDFQTDLFPKKPELYKYSKIMCLSEDYDALLSIAKLCHNMKVQSAFSMSSIFEINPNQVNKGLGLKYFLKQLGLDYALISAAGNDQNDFELLKMADQKYAPVGSRILSVIKQCEIVFTARTGLLTPMMAHFLSAIVSSSGE